MILSLTGCSRSVAGNGGKIRLSLSSVLSAAAMRCLHGVMVGRLVVDTPELEQRVHRMGIADPDRIYEAQDLAPGRRIIFAACGVTGGFSGGGMLNGVRFFGEGCRTQSLVMTLASRKVRFVDTIHLERPPGREGYGFIE
jgi:fructose-1,6-bisphosphatase/sedoheptulose 1,7-bisphosphatase-like protein